MVSNLFDWLVLVTRWLHIVTAISWIGSSFFFNWLDRRLKPKADSGDGHKVGELWVVHGGGFYHFQKLPFGMTQVPDVLHWVKWEAAWTWLSGLLLLLLVYYSGGGVMLIDPEIADIAFAQAAAIGLGTILASWLFYDLIWQSKLAEKPGLAHGITITLACGVAYWLCAKLSGRAAYIHMGGVLGTWMVANVWQRILPGQAKSLAAVEAGEPIDPAWARNAKNRSVHNNYFTLPVIFIMLSNHFPATYGHDQNWLILILVGLAGAGVRHFFNIRATQKRSAWLPLLPTLLGLALVIILTHDQPLKMDTSPSADLTRVEGNHVADASTFSIIDAQMAGTVVGTVFYPGPARVRKKLRLPAECSYHGDEPPLQQSLMVNDGRLQNAFVWIAKGLEDYRFPVPQEEVEIDQKGCIYIPHMVGAQVGQKVTFINSDPVLHNVKTTSTQNRRFNRAMPKQDSRMTQVFKKPEIAVPVKCSLHPWMGAFIGVVSHPYFAVTDEAGNFSLANMPPGEYEIAVWHKKTGELRKKITVQSQAETKTDFTVSAKSKK